MAYRLTNRARHDVLEIWAYIAGDSESAADRFIDRLTRHFKILGDFPQAGRTRNELRPGYRSLPVGDYLIFYKIGPPGIRVMHVVRGQMDLDRYPFGS